MTKVYKVFKRSFFIMLSMVIVFSCANVVFAADNSNCGIAPRYTDISRNTVNFSKSGIKVTGTATLTAIKSMSLKVKMEVQKKSSGTYSTVETWTASKTGTSLSLSKSRNINLLYDYRLKVTFTAGSESTVVYKYLS